MDYVQGNRLVKKSFKCNKCKETCIKFVNPFKLIINCQKCGSYLAEVKIKNTSQEKRDKIYKKSYTYKTQENKKIKKISNH